MNMMKNLTKTFTLAMATLALSWAASAADGSIYSIHPLDADGNINPPSAALNAGDVARFVVRLQAKEPGKQFVLQPTTPGGEWMENVAQFMPKIGIFVSGQFRLANLEYCRVNDDTFTTDLVFSYRVESGDFARPIRLANASMKPINDASESNDYYIDLLGLWKVSNADGDANFQFAMDKAPVAGVPEEFLTNYDFTACRFYTETVFFEDAAAGWTVHQGEVETKSVQTSGMPTNNATFYVWSMDESKVPLVDVKDDPNVTYSTRKIHFSADDLEGQDRLVAQVKLTASAAGYKLHFKGVADGDEGDLVLSAFPDFNYHKVGDLAKERLDDYATVHVAVTEPRPASVEIAPKETRVVATSASATLYVTELDLHFTQAFTEDVEVSIVPGFSAAGNPLPWSDYVRFSEKSADPIVPLQDDPSKKAVVVIPANGTVPTRFKDGPSILDGKIYVYALRSDAFSNGTAALMTFAAHTENTAAQGAIENWDTVQSTLQIVSQDPVILEPAAGAEQSATAGEKHNFTIKVSDNYANMTNAYKVSVWKDKSEGDFVELDGEYVPDAATGVLYKKGTRELPNVSYLLKSTPYETSLKVKSAVSGNESAPVDVSVKVTARKGYTIAAADGVTDLREGSFTQVAITFEDIVTDDCYAYLQPVDEATNVVANCTWLAAAGGRGKLVRAGTVAETALTLDRFKITDGDEIGSQWEFNVVLLKTPAWSDAEDAKYGKFAQNNTLRYTVTNIRPTVAGVTPDKKAAKKVKENGGEIKGGFPVSDTVEHVFRLDVTEPGDYDRLIDEDGKRFETVWVFYNEDEGDAEYYPAEEVEEDTGLVYGDPATNTCTMVFTNPGRYRAEVRVKDKDMADYDDEALFTFYFDVVDHPAFTVETESSYQERDVDQFEGEAKVTLKFASNPCNFLMYAKLKVRSNVESDNPGLFLLETNTTSVVYHDEAEPYYIVTIPKGALEVELPVLLMDGTRSPTVSEFTIEAELPEELNSEKTVPGSESEYPWQYFVWADAKPFKVRNDPPNVILLNPEGGTNVYASAASESDVTITWDIDDVTPDFERPVEGGLTVKFTGGGGTWETNVTSYAEMSRVGAAGFRPNFSGKSGKQQVTMVVKDHDGGQAGPFTWNFEITASKSLQMIAHGPTSGFGANNGDRYATKAEGLGEGRTWADSRADGSVSFWTSYVNCALESRFTVYAYGYKVGDIDDGTAEHLHYPDGRPGYYVDRDTPISGAGKSLAKGAAADNYYHYVPRKDVFGRPVDSFLYTWLQISTDDSGGKGSGTLADAFLNETIAPEMSEQKDSGRVVMLSAEKDQEGNYPVSQVEAVFSVEQYWSDNLGDINQDGIPDAYAKKYGFGVFDEDGKVTGDDLLKLTGYNEDEDYLPTGEQQTYLTYIPGLPDTWETAGAKFTAQMEIRGYDSHLNDAPVLVGMTGVKPERVYEVDGQWSETNCTLSYLEYVAWTESGLPADQWSPERPTDPTKDDTDEDGFTDGYEYYFWYRAHVGYFDANGVHRRLTGRAYDPRNPGEGRFISSAEIERLMDPMLPSGDASSANLRDTDNDGLPDLLEFEIGTNPFDFDTDGDGLPDGFEILLNGTSPLTAYTTKNLSDAMRNYDGDAMAFTTPELEAQVLPKPLEIKTWTSLAAVTDDFAGDSEGVQWYVTRDFSFTNYTARAESGYVVQTAGARYFTTNAVRVTADGRLATDLTALGAAWAVTNVTQDLAAQYPQLGDALYLRLAPVRLALGTPLELIEHQAPPPEPGEGEEEEAAEPEMVKEYVVAVGNGQAVSLVFEEATEGLNAAWIYGSNLVSTKTDSNNMLTLGGFGMLAVGRYLDVPAKATLAALPSAERPVALMHYLVYQEFGFDPRTAWNAHTPLAPRWGSVVGGEAVESQYNKTTGGYAGVATRTREFTAYDEFLLCSFWLNNGTISDADVTATLADPWYKIWSKYTTNPQGPGETWEPDDESYKGRTAETASDTNGADSDGDGVPDGWELYVMSGPKLVDPAGLKFRFVAPYDDNHFSHFGPFVGDAASASWTDASGTSGYASTPGDNDKLTELREYAGTDSCNWYSKVQSGNKVAFSTTIVRPDEDKKWLNKFFPTDPWNADTDNDGIADGWEIVSYLVDGTTAYFSCAKFIYGTPVDDNSICIPGGGLNPLTVDTDGDGLPDKWEAQFAGSKVYAGEFTFNGEPVIDYTTDAETGAQGNPRQGLTDGMDGTVADAFSYPITIEDGGVSNIVRWTVTDGGKIQQVVNRDYDHDGLENWQEYMTGMMRCWRYDDPCSSWTCWPEEMCYTKNAAGQDVFDVKKAAKALFPDDADPVSRFWFETLVNVGGAYYNPHLIAGQSAAKYMSRVTNPWDKAFTDEGTYYWMSDRIGDTLIAELWCNPMAPLLPISGKMSTQPNKYACCSPLEADSDHDGMDDYYELFHGMNPLLGASGVVANSGAEDTVQQSVGPCDLVYDAWYVKGEGALEAWAQSADDTQANYWQRDAGLKARHEARFAASGVTPPENGYDFEVYPWLNGLQMADPDGDDIRNLSESIQPKLSNGFYLHTDPTPLWMTDSSYADSLVRRFFRLQTRPAEVELPGESFTYGGTTYFFRDCDGYVPPKEGLLPEPPKLAAYTPDSWSVEDKGGYNWMFSFEENEGYDSDHDAVSDYEEAQGTKRAATDPQDADSPRRRQAMYFPGWDAEKGVGSALQTLPEEIEKHPLGATDYPDRERLQTFTVECWVLPETVDDNEAQTVLERAIWVGASQVADKEYMRKNFQISIRNGRWYAKYDTDGTEPTDAETGKCFEFYSEGKAVAGRWTHVAATYDGQSLSVFIDGVQQPSVTAHLAPACGISAMAFKGDEGHAGDYWFAREYGYHAFVVGASLKGSQALGPKGYDALDVTRGSGWGSYCEFFRGYVDEIRVWDGARASDDVIDDFMNRKRYDRKDALDNRSSAYVAYLRSARVPELLHHWSFDSVPGAENAAQVARWPRGYAEDDCPALSRPAGYVINWWKGIVDAFGSVYAGNADWVTWIPDTVGHLPRYDGTTIDSAFWSVDYAGLTPGAYAFPMTAEPVTRWTQMTYGGVESALIYRSTGLRHRLVNEAANGNKASTLYRQFEFAGRNLTCSGSDLLPLGGAFVKYVPAMWDDIGASSLWDQTGSDANANGLPDWWEAYADQNYRPADVPPGTGVSWNSTVVRNGVEMTAGEAYLRDLAAGMYVNAQGKVEKGPTAYAQTAKTDGLIPDWWKELYKIDGKQPLEDSDFDGLNNYHEYLASEELPFGMALNPLMARTDSKTIDYFRTFGKLYVGEMLTDHDLMEDTWERSLGDTRVADATVWDALRDTDEDGWTNFDENRYNGYKMSTLAQLVSHAVGDGEVLDAPVPFVKLLVRYNGTHFSDGTKALVGGGSGGGKTDANPDAGGMASDITVSQDDVPQLIVRTYTQSEAQKVDAEFKLTPGESVSRAVYVGSWEDRIVRGMMTPGNVDLGSVNIKFAQVPQSDKYSWSDEKGLHLSESYEAFKAALERDPSIIQNLQDFEWLELRPPADGYVSSDRAVTVTREGGQQVGYIAIYGERVGTIDLTTGEFEFDMGAMMRLSPNYTFKDTEAGGWSYQEAIFKLTYEATVPSVQTERFQVSLAKADKGFIRGGRNTVVAFFDNDGSGDYTPGEPYGVVRDVDIGWAGRTVEIELTDMSAITPRVNLWDSSCDRVALVGADEALAAGEVRHEAVAASAPRARVRIVRDQVDGEPIARVGVVAADVMEKLFDQEERSFLSEVDFLADGSLDVDWDGLYADVVSKQSVQRFGCNVTNVSYRIVYNWDPGSLASYGDTNTTLRANAVTVNRRFEKRRTVPAPCGDRMVCNRSRPTFAWKIEGEDAWASFFGTTYTAFKLRVRNTAGQLVYDSGITRLPPKSSDGVYEWTAPICVGSRTPQGVVFANLANYTWQVALYNAKFRTDDIMEIKTSGIVTGDPFCAAQSLRMNVTTADTSSRQIAVRVCYAGPAKNLTDKVRVQAFETPDFTGDPVAEATVSTNETMVTLVGLDEGSYFVRAYIDTNGNGVRDVWESWGYLCERDRANKSSLFNPVMAEAKFSPNTQNVRTVYVEDCDTNGNFFPDVWEAEQNGNRFDPAKIGPVTGNAELIGVNPNLKSSLSESAALASPLPRLMSALSTPAGVSLVTGIDPADVAPTADGFEVKSEVDPETLTIVGLNVDAANSRVTLKVGAETTANVDAAVANFLNVKVKKGAEVTVRVEYAATPAGPWTVAKGADGKEISGTVTVDRAGTDITVKLDGKLPAQGFFRAKIEE